MNNRKIDKKCPLSETNGDWDKQIEHHFLQTTNNWLQTLTIRGEDQEDA